jgi:hypothetical protein
LRHRLKPSFALENSRTTAVESHISHHTIDAVSHLLDSCITHPEASVIYNASDMQVKIHRDAYFLSEPKAKSIIGGYFFWVTRKAHPRNSYPMAYSNMWSLLWLKPNLVHFL